jgi:carboxylesterase
MMLRLPKRTRPGSGEKSALFLRGGPRGLLCLHGFTGTPFEVRPLAEALAGQGFTVAAPVLAGHCTTVDDLRRTCWTDWLGSASAALDELRAVVPGPVAIAGFSMGSLLALRLAHERASQIAALVSIAAPLRLRAYQVRAVRFLASLPAALRRGPLAVLPKFGGYDVIDADMKQMNPGLPGMPIAGIHSLIELSELVRRELPDIRVPALVVHGALDRTVPPGDSLELARSLGSPVIEALVLPRSGHLVAIDVERAALIETVTRFLDRHLPARQAAAGGNP